MQVILNSDEEGIGKETVVICLKEPSRVIPVRVSDTLPLGHLPRLIYLEQVG